MPVQANLLNRFGRVVRSYTFFYSESASALQTISSIPAQVARSSGRAPVEQICAQCLWGRTAHSVEGGCSLGAIEH